MRPTPLSSRTLLSFVFVLFVLPSIGPALWADAPVLGDLTGSWQLLVDDYLIDAKSGLTRTYHQFQKSSPNPVIVGDEPWENDFVYLYGTVLPNEDSTGYRMWYHGYSGGYTDLYATSEDGINWVKPNLGLYGDNNIFMPAGRDHHLPQVIHTPWEADPQSQYKLVGFSYDQNGYVGATSPDGIHWTNLPNNPFLPDPGDVGNFVWDAHEDRYLGTPKQWVSVRGFNRRSVGVTFSDDFENWSPPLLVLTPDEIDDHWTAGGGQHTDFYGLSAFAYESGYLGFLWIFQITDGGNDGPIYPELVSSHDGVHWTRQEAAPNGGRTPLLPLGAAGTWDDGMIFTPNHPLVEGDTIKLYYGGINDTHGYPTGSARASAIGLATMRKDGFVSLDAAETTGTVTTKWFANMSGPLLINADSAGGWLRAEVLDSEGQVIPGYAAADCTPVSADGTNLSVSWGGQANLPVSAELMQLRFLLNNASLYSFMAGENLDVYIPTIPVIGTFDKKGVLLTFEGDTSELISDKFIADESQDPMIFGDITVVDDPGQAGGGERYASFPNAPSTATVLEIPNTNMLGKAFTLAASVEETGSSPYSRLFSAYDGGTAGGNELVFDFDDTGTQPGIEGMRAVIQGTHVVREAAFDDGEYHHLALTYRDGKVRLFLDGQQLGDETTVPGGAIELLYNLRFGEDHGGTSQTNEPFEGRADDILVYRRPLAPSQMAALAANGAEAFFGGQHGTHLTAEGDVTFAADSLDRDGLQNGVLNNSVSVDTNAVNARVGSSSFEFAADAAGWSTIELADTSYLGDEFTLAAFVNTGENNFMRLFSSYDGEGEVGDNEMLFDFKPDGSEVDGLRFMIGSNVLTADAPVGFSLDEYHHLAVTYDDGDVTLFLDGVVVATGDFGMGAIDLAADLLVGGDLGGTADEQLIGHLDEILVLYETLSPSEIADIANPVRIPGDANGDGQVDATDVAILASNWLTLSGAEWAHGDFNDDGAVNDSDATILAANWLAGVDAEATVPEPSAIWMLLGGLGVLLVAKAKRPHYFAS